MLVVAEMRWGWLVLGVMATVAAVGGGLGKVFTRVSSMTFAMDVEHEAEEREDEKNSDWDGDGDGYFGVPAQTSAAVRRGSGRIGRRCWRG